MPTHKKDIIKQVADKLNLSERETGEVIQTFIDTFLETLLKEGRLELRGLGVFEVKQHKGRMIRNIKTGELVQTRSYKKIEYKTSKVIKKILNPPPAPKRKLKRKLGQ